MKNTLVAILSIMLFTISCKKLPGGTGDVGGNLYIVGRVFLADTINNTASYKYPIGNLKIYVAYKNNIDTTFSNPDSINYLYNTYSDSNGYFVFQNLNKSTYFVYATDTINGISYFGHVFDTLMKGSYDTSRIVLYPYAYNKNGVIFTTFDSTANADTPISGASIFIYNSMVLAVADTYYNGKGAIDSIVSNANGKAVKTQLPANQLLFIKANYNNNGLILNSSIDTVTLNTYGYTSKSIILDTAYTSLTLITQDAIGGIIPGVTTFIYTSRIVFDLDLVYAGAGALSPSLISNNYGMAYIINLKLPSNDSLYVRSFIKIDSNTTLRDSTVLYLPYKANTKMIQLQ